MTPFGMILRHMINFNLVFQALADPGRQTMIERLSRGAATLSELAAPLAMSLPAVMQHLKMLEAGGLVSSSKSGRVRTCRLNAEVLGAAEQWLAARRLAWRGDAETLLASLNP